MKTKQKQIKKPVVARSKVSKPVSVRSKKTKVVRAKVKRSAKKMLVPHKVNGYRPHLIRAHGLTAVLVVALLSQMLYGFMTTGQPSILGRVSNVQADELLQYTNEERVANGLGELTADERLSQAANLKAQDMIKSNYWAHTSPTGTEPWKWFSDVEYSYSVAGENLAKNYPTAAATVEAWMGSASHRSNLLNNKYVDVGFAVVEGEIDGQDTTVVVALYGAPAPVAVLGSNSAPGATTFTAAAIAGGSSSNPLAYFGSAAQSLSPVTIAMLGLMALVAIVGVVAHLNRAKLPKAWKKNWKAHHGMYTFMGMFTLGVLIILATGGGQI